MCCAVILYADGTSVRIRTKTPEEAYAIVRRAKAMGLDGYVVMTP
jgi:hypothetical protein